MRRIVVSSENRLLAAPFRIAGQEHFDVTTVTVEIGDAGRSGRGECNPYSVPGWSRDRAIEEIEQLRVLVEAGIDRFALLDVMPPGPARNALDCALVDLECSERGVSAGALLGIQPGGDVVSAMTIGIEDRSGGPADANPPVGPVVKLKIDGRTELSLLDRVRAAAPNAVLIVDANGSLTERDVSRWLPHLSSHRVRIFEQPMAPGDDAFLASVDTDVLICADESFQSARDLVTCLGIYDVVNVKLDKVGGVTAGSRICALASELGLSVMVGCMMGSSLSAAPAWWLAHLAQYVDIDGPTLLKTDIDAAMTWRDGVVSGPAKELWGW